MKALAARIVTGLPVAVTVPVIVLLVALHAMGDDDWSEP